MFPAARQRYHYNHCSQQHVEGLIQYNTRRKRLSGTKFEKETKPSLFVNNVILNKENPGALQATRINKKAP